MKYNKWLFDSKDAWALTVQDTRFDRDIPFDEFMAIYQSYRCKKPAPVVIKKQAPVPEPKKAEILDQDDIDKLIEQLAGHSSSVLTQDVMKNLF